jgi:hypothetical protein
MRAEARAVTLLTAGLAVACQRGADPSLPAVVFSEILYHPVDDGPDEPHEFVELANRTDRPVALDGFRVAGGIDYTFPAGSSLPPRGFLVLARNRQRLLADLPDYRLDPAAVLGDYRGELDNDGDQLVLLDAAGAKLDEVFYSDSFPWPTGPDALGASDDWLPPATLPLERHRGRGRALERISLDHPPTVANWTATPLDGATPGRGNPGSAAPPATALSLTARPARADRPRIGGDDPVRVTARLTPGPLAQPQLEYFLDDIESEDEPRQRVPLASGRDPAGETTLRAELPPQPAGSVVRYRLLADRGAGLEVIAPRAGDPFEHFAYFVSPEIEGQTPVYQLFIKRADWTRIWDTIAPGRVPGNGNGTNPFACAVNDRWNERVPAVLAVDGEVYDVRVRHQGSFQQRRAGLFMLPMRWPATAPVPDRPLPVRVFSWSIKFPRYRRLDDVRSFTLNKLGQSCHGFNTLIGHALFERAGIPAARSQFVRLYVGGAYYHYMLRIEHMDEDFLRRAFGKGPRGDLFKSVGGRWDEGPYGYSDERPLAPYCGYSTDERYEINYQRMVNPEKRGSGEMRELIEALQTARADGLPAIRRFFEGRFDMTALTSYLAVINWMVAWDDQYHNHYLYRRPDGRWMLMPTDLDNVMGGAPPSTADASFFVGQWNVRSNRNDYWNQLKDAYLRAFRDEFLDRLRELDRTILHPDAVAALADELAPRYRSDEALTAPAGMSCGPAEDDLQRLKDFAYARSARIAAGLFD